MDNSLENKKYIKKFLEACRENIYFIQNKEYNSEKTVFTISSTSNNAKNKLPYTTPPRFNKYFGIAGCILFTQTQAIKVAQLIDGLVDIIAVDAEKKIPILTMSSLENSILSEDIRAKIKAEQKTTEIVESGNLSAVCYEVIRRSTFFEFKPNDLTVDAVWAFVSNQLKFLSGRKIAIVGAGNIGSKLALKFVESGSNVNIYRRDKFAGVSIAQAINFIKPESTISTVDYIDSIIKTCFMADVIIGCTSGVPVIEWEHIAVSNKNSIIIDIGKGSIIPEAIETALKKEKSIYRADVSCALDGQLITLIRNEEIVTKAMGRRKLGNCVMVSGGIMGNKEDIVVDNINVPQIVIGIANGSGDLIRKPNSHQRKKLADARRLILQEQNKG